ncbi:UNVERIFIED_ORG: hypothetical protein M2438_004862 [Methylobacterium sp. SuP10 SLI 274]|uniref:hypothetical protein n=1 Tax=Methylorubrum extorquens TaxID=408 RepID=UPI00209D78F1|nr:hypothetical protein [Methylorubrum extorquens]MDF9866139.1 hypothetical protein [Methylorubrum pseudosasae]MDH6639687.1 hypothetical protein [Methylobacterium sp. SuP10 SLI 274]MDH6668880.1 hypothetical protein [Methylorubrum zatmanii]MCP1560760.1 hypothetical protein [Methylorubrum extorquens]MDF9794438.1 hypothetical protein [Methylorubrum extorquens]
MIVRSLIAATLIGGMAYPAAAQDTAPPPAATAPQEPSQNPSQEPSREAAPPRPIRNAPSPRALEFAAYIFSAVNVCGYRLNAPEFEALLAKQNTRPEDVSPRGPFGNRVIGIFTLMSNQMNLNREQACLAVAGEYGPEGNVVKNVLLPPGSGEPGGKPAQP